MEYITLILSISSILIALLGCRIVYLQYKSEVNPSLDVIISFCTNEKYKELLHIPKEIDTIPEGIYGYLWFQLTNTGRRIIIPMAIFTEPNEKLIIFIKNEKVPGHELQDGKFYQKFSPLNINEIKKIRNAKKIYVEDSRKTKHYLSSKLFKQLLEDLKDFS